MSDFTPGPWTVETDDEGIYVLMGTLKGDDEHLAIYTAPYNAHTEFGSHLSSERRIADARLIAAAPDLLAAAQLGLRIAMGWYENGDYAGSGEDILEEMAPIRAALAKATGEAVAS